MSAPCSATTGGNASSAQLPAAMGRWYVAALLALVLHQIDAAYWQEWVMFGVPGGVHGFLMFNLVAVGAVVLGYQQVLTGGRFAVAGIVLCGSLGVLTGVLHLMFAWFGHDEFALPLSLVVIGLCLATGAALLGALALARRKP